MSEFITGCCRLISGIFGAVYSEPLLAFFMTVMLVAVVAVGVGALWPARPDALLDAGFFAAVAGLHGMSFYFGAGVLPDDLGDHAPAALAVPPALRPQGQTGSEEAQEGQEGRPCRG